MRRPGKRFGFASNLELRWHRRDDKQMRREARRDWNDERKPKWVAPSRRLQPEEPTDDQPNDAKEVKDVKQQLAEREKLKAELEQKGYRVSWNWFTRPHGKQRSERFQFPAFRHKDCRNSSTCICRLRRGRRGKSLCKVEGKVKDPWPSSK